MAIDPFGTSGQLGKRHSDLKCDARFFGQDRHWPAAENCLQNRLVDFTGLLGFAFKMVLQIAISAEVRLVPIREFAFALWTLPERASRAAFHNIATVAADVRRLMLLRIKKFR